MSLGLVESILSLKRGWLWSERCRYRTFGMDLDFVFLAGPPSPLSLQRNVLSHLFVQQISLVSLSSISFFQRICFFFLHSSSFSFLWSPFLCPAKNSVCPILVKNITFVNGNGCKKILHFTIRPACAMIMMTTITGKITV